MDPQIIEAKKKGIWLIIVGFVAGVLACLMFWSLSNLPVTSNDPSPITSTPDTSTWQTYRNEEYGFEFKYPNIFNDDRAPYNAPPGSFHFHEKDNNLGVGSLKMEIRKGTIASVLDANVNFSKNAWQGDPSALLKKTLFGKINDKDIIKTEWELTAAYAPKIENYIQLAEDTVMVMGLLGSYNNCEERQRLCTAEDKEESFGKIRPIFDTIISTFKFINN
ncbi:MAG: hypothetical protein AAB453_01490 [Patescibacteria group bacterium]